MRQLLREDLAVLLLLAALGGQLVHGLHADGMTLGDPHAALRERPPEGRAGVFFIHRLNRPLPLTAASR